MTKTTNANNLRQYKSRFSLIAEQVLAFTMSTILVREIKNLSPNLTCFTLQMILIRTGRPFYRKTLISSAKKHVEIARAQLIKLTLLIIKPETCYFSPKL